MSTADAPRGLPQRPRHAARSNSDFARRIARVLYTQNPFYLLSVAFVLNSTRLWYREGTGPFDPWPLMGVIFGYIALAATTGYVLVRFGKVWDDARSIFLILLCLFVELSLTFDEILLSRPETGRALLATGLALTVAVSEGLLFGLRIRLRALYRVPYHLLLALMFLYPLAIVADLANHLDTVAWRIYLFSPIAAAAMLTLLPAIRRGADYAAENGTPWRWPWFPWSLFGFLGICTGLRAYALSLSFDPVLIQGREAAMQLESAFGLYFLAPMLMALALLILEAGIVAKDRRVQTIALFIPAICVVISFPQQNASAPYADFLNRFIDRAGSPVWLSAIVTIAFYGVARLRRVRFAGEAFWFALLVASCITTATRDLGSLVPPQGWALWLVAAVQGAIGLQRRNSARVLLAAACAVAAFRSDFLMGLDSQRRAALVIHFAGISVLCVGAFFDDGFARWLRKAGLALVIGAAVLVAVQPPGWTLGLPRGAAPAYLAIVVTATFAYAYFVRSPAYFFAGLANLCICSGKLLYELAGHLQRLLSWKGAAWFAWGLAWFALAALISARKAGFTRWLVQIVPGAKRNDRDSPQGSTPADV